MTNPLSPDYFSLRQEQAQEGLRREAFGGGEEPLTTFTDSGGDTFEGVPDLHLCIQDPLGQGTRTHRETVEFRGTQVEVVDPIALDPLDARANQILSEIAAIRSLNARVQTETFEDTVMEVLDEAFNLIVDRQRTYGPDNIREQGLFGIINRIGMDKLARIRQRLNGQVVNGQIILEDIEMGSVDEPGFTNDLFDVIGYAVCGVLLARGKWGKPLIEEVEDEG